MQLDMNNNFDETAYLLKSEANKKRLLKAIRNINEQQNLVEVSSFENGERDMQNLIVFNPDVMMGKAVIAGTRITVELILEKMAAGETIEQILEAHPRLTRAGIQAALSFAAKALRADVLYPLVEAA